MAQDLLNEIQVLQGESLAKLLTSGESLPSTGFLPKLDPADFGLTPLIGKPRPSHDSNTFVDFLGSALHAGTVGLAGVQPEGNIQRFREEHPGLGLISEIAGSTPAFLLPFAGSGVLGLKLAQNLPRIGGVVKGLTSGAAFAEKPVVTSALTEIARFAPLETARIGAAGTAELLGEDGAFGRTVGNVAFELPFFGGIGALAGKFGTSAGSTGKALRKRRENSLEFRVMEQLDGYDPRAPIQVKARAISKAISDLDSAGADLVDIELRQNLGNLLVQFRDEVLEETFEKGERVLFRPLAREVGKDKAGSSARLNSLVRGTVAGVTPRRLIKNEGKEIIDGFDSQEEISGFLGLLPEGFEETIQGVRALIPEGAAAIRKIDNVIRTDFVPIAKNAFLAREKDGLFAMMLRVPSESIGTAFRKTVGAKRAFGGMTETEAAAIRGSGRPFAGLKTFGPDRYLIFRTDDPTRIVPGIDSITKGLTERFVRPEMIRRPIKGATPTANAAITLRNRFGPMIAGVKQTLENVGFKKGPNVSPSRLERALGPELADNISGSRQFLRGLGLDLKPFVVPAATEFSELSSAQALFQAIKQVVDRMTAVSMRDAFGELAPKSGRAAGAIIGKQRRPETSPVDDILGLAGDDQARLDYLELVARNLDVEQVGVTGKHPLAIKAYESTRKLFAKYHEEARDQVKLFDGNGDLELGLPDPGGLNHITGWRGIFRLPIFAKGNVSRIEGYATGRSLGQAMREAEEIANVLEREGTLIQRYSRTGREPDRLSADNLKAISNFADDVDLVNEIADPLGGIARRVRELQLGLKIPESTPGFLGLRKSGLVSPTVRELRDQFVGQVVAANQKLTNHAILNTFKSDLDDLRRIAPDLAKQMEERIAGAVGRDSVAVPMLKAAERAIDDILVDRFGANPATELVRKMNRAVFTLTLGAGDAGFALLNSMTPVQTALPELSFILTAPPARLAYAYSDSVLIGGSGRIREVGFAEPWRIFRQTLKELGSKDPELLEHLNWAMANNTITRPFVESFAGQNSEIATNFKGLMSGETGVVEWLASLSEFLPAKSEEFSRGFSFMLGRKVYKDFFGLEGNQLLAAAREFTHRTNFGYTSFDRSRITNGAIGTGFGLFKTFVINYINNMSWYAGEALFKKNYAPLLWAGIGTFSVGGAAALPLYGVANVMSKMVSDKGLMEHTYNMAGFGDNTMLADAIQYGLPSAVGISMQARTAVPGAALVRDANLLFSVATFDRAAALKDALGGALDAWTTDGAHPATSPKVRDQLIRAFAPRSVQRYMSVTNDGVLRSLRTGNRLQSNISQFERILNASGIQPLTVDKAFTAGETLYESQNKTRDLIRLHAQAISEARARNDHREAAAIYNMALARGLPPDSVARGVQVNSSKDRTDLIDRQFEDVSSFRVRELMGLR